MSVFPYSTRISTAITESGLGHLCKVTVDAVGTPAFTVDPKDVSVTFAEDWTPHIQASIKTAIPTLAQLDLMDPRLNCRVMIEAGYLYPDGTEDIHDLADLGLRTRNVSRPADEVSITASSDEAKGQDRCRAYDYGPFDNFTGINELVQYFADLSIYPETAVVVSDYPTDAGYYSIYGMTAPVGTSMWDVIADAAARSGVWVRCTSDRRWRIGYRANTATDPQHALEVGRNGTIITSDSTLDRTGWANHSIVEYSWTDDAGDSHKVYGRARVTSGDYSVDVVGYKTDRITLDRAATQSQADAAATTRVGNLVTRGRSLTLEAHAAYWLRPGMAISVKLLTGATELHLIKTITFEPGIGKMTIETRQPVDVTITTGE